MEKEIFKNRLIESSESAKRLAREITTNRIAEDVIYRITPNSFDLSENLSQLEKEYLINRSKELRKTFTIDEVAERLIIDNKVPLWINCSVIRTNEKVTVIELVTSRRIGEDKELYNQQEKFPPFHVVIQFPPYLLIDSKKKFNINWRFQKVRTAFKLLIYRSKLKIK